VLDMIPGILVLVINGVEDRNECGGELDGDESGSHQHTSQKVRRSRLVSIFISASFDLCQMLSYCTSGLHPQRDQGR